MEEKMSYALEISDFWFYLFKFLSPKTIAYVLCTSNSLRNLLIPCDSQWANLMTSRWKVLQQVDPKILTFSKWIHFVSIDCNTKLQYYLPIKINHLSCTEWSDFYGVINILKTDPPAFCTTSGINKNVDILFSLSYEKLWQYFKDPNIKQTDYAFVITGIQIVKPLGGYTAPIDCSTIFVSTGDIETKPFDLVDMTKYNDLSVDEYLNSFANSPIHERQTLKQPIFYHSVTKLTEELYPSDDTKCTDKRLVDHLHVKKPEELSMFDINEQMPSGKTILFKIINSSGDKSNIDLQFFGLKGYIINLKTCEYVEFKLNKQ